MDLTQLINHPEQMNRETLYELRSLLALHPYYQTARLLMLQNLYLLHDATFDAELRKAAVYFSDRKVLFNLVEAAHYQLGKEPETAPAETNEGNRTITLINDFLESIPKARTSSTTSSKTRAEKSNSRTKSTTRPKHMTCQTKMTKMKPKKAFLPRLWPKFTSNRGDMTRLWK